MYGRKSTKIDDLLDLDDPSDGSEGFSNRNVGSYTNAIRSNNPNMFRGNAIDGAKRIEQYRQSNNFQNQRPPMHPQNHPQNHPQTRHQNHQNHPQTRHQTHSPYKQSANIYEGYENDITCQQVLKHISNCPICSKFYNNDRTVYIIIIVILIIICLLLFKKVLDV